ncbi:MAG: PQQ-binding-like beta-propeller repeat protein [Planctomycetaceae bacterium]|nr:PQQ-binding-like beta-propeller repeat protein [Planctomycetaceae bacterium]
MPANRSIILICFASALAFTSMADAEDWRQFRGDDLSGLSPKPLPTEISGDTIQWEVDLPGRGLSAPIVVGDRVYLSASSGFDQDRLHLLCFDKQTGEEVFERQFWATGRTVSHPKMANATPTPCSDGKRIFATFSSNDVICIDLDGNLQWFRGMNYDYPNATNSLGMSSSPVVVDDTLIVQVESDADSFAFGLDVANGKTRWQKERPRKANWTSPTVVTKPEPLVLLQSASGIEAVKPKSGDTIWKYESGASTIPSSLVQDDILYIPSNGITAVSLTSGNGEEIWNVRRLSPSTPSPILANGMLITVSNVKIAAANPEDGEVLWESRVSGPFSASPIAAGKYLYLFNEKGLAQVVEITKEEGKVVSDYDFGEIILGTPAASDGAIFVRSDEHLWKIGK